MPFSGFQAASFGQSQAYVNLLKILSRLKVEKVGVYSKQVLYGRE